MEFYISPSLDAAWNLALEELLWQREEEAFMLWRNAPAVIVGRHQNTLVEVDRNMADARGIAVVRRMSGGGAVYHDLGNINFSWLSPAIPWSAETAAVRTQPVLGALAALGAPSCSLSGRNDILCNGVKVSGCARSIQKKRMLFHGTLLYDADLSVLSSVLTPDPEKIRSKGIASVRSRVGNLRAIMGAAAPDVSAFLSRLTEEVSRELHLAGPAPLPDDLIRLADDLAARKYRTRTWNWGTAFPYDISRQKRFSAGLVTAEMQIRNDRIVSVHFTGDFFADGALDELEAGLAGTVPEAGPLLEKLRQLQADDVISGVSASDLAGLLCCGGSLKSAKKTV